MLRQRGQRPYRSRASWGRPVALKTQLATVFVLCYHSNRATWCAAVASMSRGGWGRVLGCVLTMLGIKADTFGSASGVSSPVSHPSTDRTQFPPPVYTSARIESLVYDSKSENIGPPQPMVV